MKKNQKRSKQYVIFVICILTVVVGFQLFQVYQQHIEKQNEIEVLKKKIEEENQKNLKLREYEKYMETDAYVEEKAREEFNLIKDGEEVYIIKKE